MPKHAREQVKAAIEALKKRKTESIDAETRRQDKDPMKHPRR